MAVVAAYAVVHQLSDYVRADMRMSDRALNLLAEFEGFRETAYNCSAGHATIGYGHKLHDGACTKVDLSLRWSQSHALSVLREDVQKAEELVKKYVVVPASQGMFDALVSMTFNMGHAPFRNDDKSSTMLAQLLNSGDMLGAALQIPRFIYAGGKRDKGLLKRRLREAQLFLA